MTPDIESHSRTETASDRDFEELLSAATGQPIQPRSPSSSTVGKLLWALAAVPLMALVLLGTMAVRVRLAEGYWPTQNQPDPKELGIHNSITVAAIVASFAVVLLIPLIALTARLLGQARTPVRPPILAVAGFVLMMLVIRADLGGLGDWIAD